MKTANENGVKYIQLDIGFFDNKKIKAIRGLPSGSDILVIWIELLVLAGQINDCGSIYFNHEVPYTADMLAAQFGFPLATIQLALTTFVKFEMVEIIDDVIMISNWRKYQNENALERIKMLHNARQRAYYQRKKSQRITDGSVSADVSNSVISDENCSYISNISNTSSLSKDNEDKNTGCGEKEKKPKKNRKEFIKPTVEEVTDYCRERDNSVDPEAFIAHYESNGWMVGKTPMQNWKMAVITWEKNDKKEVNNGGISGRNACQKVGRNRKSEGVPNLKPRFVGHIYDADGNDITPGD